MSIVKAVLCVTFFCLCHGWTSPRKRGRIWEAVDSVSSDLPYMVDLLKGKTSIGRLSWSEINTFVKNLIGQVDEVSESVGEVQEDLEEHAMGFVGATVTLALFSGLILLLICFFAVRMKKRGRTRSNTPSTSNLENIRRNLQEFMKILRMSIGSLPIPLQGTSSYQNPGFNPYFNSNGPPNYVPPQGYNQAMVAPPAAPPVVPPPATAPAANIVPPNNGR